jgi:RES domain-containing protein
VLQAWRIIKKKYRADAFTGEGARFYGGRWNSPGVRVVYTSSSLSLALLEILVNLESPLPLPAYSYYRVEFQETLVESMDPQTLPDNWRRYPAPVGTQQVGDQWVQQQRSCVLAVPSVVVPVETTYIFNPLHPAFSSISISPAADFSIDSRLEVLAGG